MNLATPEELQALAHMATQGSVWPYDDAAADLLDHLVDLGLASRTYRCPGAPDYAVTRYGLAELGWAVN